MKKEDYQKVKKFVYDILPEKGKRELYLELFNNVVEDIKKLKLVSRTEWEITLGFANSKIKRIRLYVGKRIIATIEKRKGKPVLWLTIPKKDFNNLKKDESEMLESSFQLEKDPVKRNDYKQGGVLISHNFYFFPEISNWYTFGLGSYSVLRKLNKKFISMSRDTFTDANYCSEEILQFLKDELANSQNNFSRNSQEEKKSSLNQNEIEWEEQKKYDDIIESEIENSEITEKESLIKSRYGQGKFRNSLIDYWEGKCSVTGCEDTNLLVASHIKPWAWKGKTEKDKTTNKERLSKFNGLLLTPNLDKVFDKGLITFNDNGEIKISNKLSYETMDILGINEKMKLQKQLEENHKYFLKIHRNNIFVK